MRLCSVEGCGNEHDAKGFCNKHYKRVYTEDPIKRKARHNLYAKNNPGKINAKKAKRRALEKSRIPKWADLKAISNFYENCPEGYHVDHIIPLNNDYVCGLHTLDNLQYLSSHDNEIKSNSFDFTLENCNWKIKKSQPLHEELQ